MEKKYRLVDKFKQDYGMENDSDEEFTEWWSRNHGTGYIKDDGKYLMQECEDDDADNFEMTRKKAIRIGDTCLDNYHPHISHEEGDQSEALSFLITHAEKCPSCDKLEKVVGELKKDIDEIENMEFVWQKGRDSELQTLKRMYDLLTKEEK